MYKEIKIGNKNVPMTSNAATEYRCKQIFNRAILKEFSKFIPILGKGEDMSPEDQDVLIDTTSKLAYVMAMQAAKVDMTTLNEETYIQWLEDYEPLDILRSASDVIMLWVGQKEVSVIPKKETAPSIEK